MSNFIFVTGHQHSGTTILRKIIGNHKQVYEYYDEKPFDKILSLFKTENKGEFVVGKYPDLLDTELESISRTIDLTNLKIICILKDPRQVLVSIRKRNPNIAVSDFLKRWERIAQNCIELSEKDNRCILLKYEDLFGQEFLKIKETFRWLGLEYDHNIIDSNHKIVSKINFKHDVPDQMPPRHQQEAFRTYQINQPFVQHTWDFGSELTQQELKYFQVSTIQTIMEKLEYV